MKIERQGNTVKLWLSADDTYRWARRPGAAWPCSFLAGKRLFAEFADGDLVDFAVNGKSSSATARALPADEFNAITSDFIKIRTECKTCGHVEHHDEACRSDKKRVT